MEWTREWPKQAGRYWFLGYDFGSGHDQPVRLHNVSVRKIRNGFMYICDGHFIYPGKAEGLWCKAELPPWPDVSVMNDAHDKTP